MIAIDPAPDPGQLRQIREAAVKELGARTVSVEHYEIVAYTGLVGLARVMGHTECERLLNQNLTQEKDMAKFIEQNMPMVVEKIATKTGDKNMAMKQSASAR